MPKFPDLEALPDDYDTAALMDHLQVMYIDTHNIFFMVAILALHDEYNLPFDDYLLWLFSRNHTKDLLNTECEGRDLQKALSLDKPGLKRRQFEDLWDPESKRIALWYPHRLISLVDDIQQNKGLIKEAAIRHAGDLLGYSSSKVRERYYHAKKGYDFDRRIDHPDFKTSFHLEYWNETNGYEVDIPLSRTN